MKVETGLRSWCKQSGGQAGHVTIMQDAYLAGEGEGVLRPREAFTGDGLLGCLSTDCLKGSNSLISIGKV